jgi:hypothetical protein
MSDICGLHVEGHPLWPEDRSVIYSYNLLSLFGPSPAEPVTTSYCLIWHHMLLSYTKLPKPEGPGPCICIPQEQGGSVIPPYTGFPFCFLFRLTGLQWRYSKQRPQGFWFVLLISWLLIFHFVRHRKHMASPCKRPIGLSCPRINRCLLWESYGMHKFTVWTEYRA